jgi:hypothetical protein
MHALSLQGVYDPLSLKLRSSLKLRPDKMAGQEHTLLKNSRASPLNDIATQPVRLVEVHEKMN